MGGASPFILGGTLQHHYETCIGLEFASIIELLRDNTYVHNLMYTGNSIDEQIKLKREAYELLENGYIEIHKWESNVAWLESKNIENPSKILEYIWNKQDDTLVVPINKVGEMEKV